MAALRDISIIPLAAALGAEVRGLDLCAPLEDETVEALRQAWREHQVLLFRGQRLSHAQHVAFSRRFGELDDHASIPAFRDRYVPEILRVANDVVGGRKQPVGRQWHSDLSITLNPARARCCAARCRRPWAATPCSPTRPPHTSPCRRPSSA